MSIERKYHTLIVEDDPLIVDQLRGFLDQTSLFEAPKTAQNATQAMVCLTEQPCDLLLLDIELPDMSGLDLLKLFPNRPPTIVVSALAQYAVDCYDLDVADFIEKPLTYTRFLRGLRRTLLGPPPKQANQANPETIKEIKTEKKASSALPLSPTHLYFKIGRTSKRFALSDILYLEAYNTYTKLFTIDGVSVINDQISSLADELKPNNFIRAHKSYLINLIQVTKFNANTIWLKTKEIPIGRKFQKDVQDRLKASLVNT